MKNTSSSLNTSPEKLQETQLLWHNLTERSATVQVPVVTVSPAAVNPPTLLLTSTAPSTALTPESIEKNMQEIMDRQHQQQQQLKKTKEGTIRTSVSS
ncbi:hypothetical protein HHUSO_G35274 [Huso huso]|uniref:Uncharacterized protein n=1 Tax=Huso huso TaxID=61971 RepID=A0ABR0Y3P5_HUSHU